MPRVLCALRLRRRAFRPLFFPFPPSPAAMEKTYIPLRPIGVTQGVQLDAAYILMLEQKADRRIVPVLITKEDSAQIYAALTHHDYSPAALFRSLTTTFDMTVERIVLDLPFRGHTTARLWVNQQGDLRIVPTSVSMAVCISLLMHVGLYVRAVDYDVLTHQGRQEGQVALPIAAMSEALLREALKTAAQEERFELAAVLRDELRKREQSADVPEDAAEESAEDSAHPEPQN